MREISIFPTVCSLRCNNIPRVPLCDVHKTAKDPTVAEGMGPILPQTLCFFSFSICFVIVVQPCGESDQIPDLTEEAVLVSLVREG